MAWLPQQEVLKIKAMKQKCAELNRCLLATSRGKKPFVALSGKLMLRQPNRKLRPVTNEGGSATGQVLDMKSTATETVSATSASAIQGDSLLGHTAAAHSTASDIQTPVVCNTKNVPSQDNGSSSTLASKNV